MHFANANKRTCQYKSVLPFANFQRSFQKSKHGFPRRLKRLLWTSWHSSLRTDSCNFFLMWPYSFPALVKKWTLAPHCEKKILKIKIKKKKRNKNVDLCSATDLWSAKLVLGKCCHFRWKPWRCKGVTNSPYSFCHSGNSGFRTYKS